MFLYILSMALSISMASEVARTAPTSVSIQAGGEMNAESPTQAEEVPAASLSQIAELSLAELDLNRDGKVSEAEYNQVVGIQTNQGSRLIRRHAGDAPPKVAAKAVAAKAAPPKAAAAKAGAKEAPKSSAQTAEKANSKAAAKGSDVEDMDAKDEKAPKAGAQTAAKADSRAAAKKDPMATERNKVGAADKKHPNAAAAKAGAKDAPKSSAQMAEMVEAVAKGSDDEDEDIKAMEVEDEEAKANEDTTEMSLLEEDAGTTTAAAEGTAAAGTGTTAAAGNGTTAAAKSYAAGKKSSFPFLATIVFLVQLFL